MELRLVINALSTLYVQTTDFVIPGKDNYVSSKQHRIMLTMSFLFDGELADQLHVFQYKDVKVIKAIFINLSVKHDNDNVLAIFAVPHYIHPSFVTFTVLN